jgi:hypothetical protein
MRLIVQEWPGWADDRDWVVVDEDGLPGDETNYGLVAHGFGTEEAALEFIANPSADFTKGTPLRQIANERAANAVRGR